MKSILNEIMSSVTLLGIGGILGSYFHALWERQKEVHLQKQEYKENRYKVIILLLLCSLDFEKEKPSLNRHRPYINTIEDLIHEIRRELYNMILFASEEVLLATQEFIKYPSQDGFLKIAGAMRKDLWGGKIPFTKLRELFKKK
ncbi:MAG: hypothetical protein PHC34_06575 [Candidatus Gastranaerophilales bacterium]|nr:hypothetical protein [Candidatus Gastranaerophilales bacterium]